MVRKDIPNYPTEPLKCWDEAKALRRKYYEDYLTAHEKGAIRWAGGAWSFSAIPDGLGDDVYCITSEPYGATIAFFKEFAMKCQDASEAAGYARDLCAYMRNYWGSALRDEYILADGRIVKGFPTPDFIWQDHICCSHAKWYQVLREIEKKVKGKDIPMYCIDVSVGSHIPNLHDELTDWRLEYVTRQLLDGIEWLEKVTGRRFDDKKMIDAIYNEMRSTSLWAEICVWNANVPAPLDEKSMYSLYVLGTLMKHKKECVDFYEKLLAEVKDRVRRGIAACAHERCRIITDTQPPWGFLSIFRYLEREYGCVSVGSLYTFGLIGMWEVKEDGSLGPKTVPPKSALKDRETAVRMYAEWMLNKPEWPHFFNPRVKSELIIKIAKQWKLDGVALHYNRGCEGLSVHITQNRLDILRAGIPVMAFEGNMGDEREFDMPRTLARFDMFMESLGLSKIKKE